jgi:hypothetical protein
MKLHQREKSGLDAQELNMAFQNRSRRRFVVKTPEYIRLSDSLNLPWSRTMALL